MIQHAYIRLCDGLDYAMTRWWGAALALCVPLCLAVYGWDWIDRWIYLATYIIVFLASSTKRRSDTAMHKKLDGADPDPAHNGIERLDEREMPSS